MDDLEAINRRMAEFIDAIVCVTWDGDVEPMLALWARTDEVSCSHPLAGAWASGWDEVSATWMIARGIGKLSTPDSAFRPLNTIENVCVRFAPDFALVTSLYALTMRAEAEPLRLNMTNAFRRIDGEWKLILHHADKLPALDPTI